MLTIKFDFKKVKDNESFEEALQRFAKEQNITITKLPQDCRTLFLLKLIK